MNRSIRHLILAAALGTLACAGIAADPSPTENKVLAQIRQGMSEDEVIKLLGPAKSRLVGPDQLIVEEWLVPAEQSGGTGRVVKVLLDPAANVVRIISVVPAG